MERDKTAAIVHHSSYTVSQTALQPDVELDDFADRFDNAVTYVEHVQGAQRKEA